MDSVLNELLELSCDKFLKLYGTITAWYTDEFWIRRMKKDYNIDITGLEEPGISLEEYYLLLDMTKIRKNLLYIIANNYITVMKSILEIRPRLFSIIVFNDYIQHAIISGSLDMVKIILDNDGLDSNDTGYLVWLAWHNNKTQIKEYLLNLGWYIRYSTQWCDCSLCAYGEKHM